MARDGKSSPYGNGLGGTDDMALSKPADLTTNPGGAARTGLPRPVDLTRVSLPRSAGGGTMPNPASMPDGGALPFPQMDANAGGPAKNQPATGAAPMGGRKSFKLGAG